MSCGNGSVASPSTALAATAAGLRPDPAATRSLYATKLAMRHPRPPRPRPSTPTAPRLDGALADLVDATAPSLLDLHGVGVDTAAILLVAAGDNAERIRSEAAFAHLCGVAPIHASSGKIDPAPAQPRRQPPSQPRPLADRVHPHGLATPAPAPTSNAASPKAAPSPRSSASSSATSPARSTGTSPHAEPRSERRAWPR